MSRSFGRSSLRRSHPVLYLLVIAVIAVGGYFGKSYWPAISDSGVSTPATSASTGSSTVPATPTTVLVERVVDGDTLVIEGGDRIRLIGVDTPETKHPTKPPQPFGPEASAFTRRMVEGKRVEIRSDPRESKDRYGRTLGYVYVDGEFLNEQLIRVGLARALLNYPFSAEMKQRFRAAEAAAKSERLGIWSSPAQPTDVGSRPVSKKAG